MSEAILKRQNGQFYTKGNPFILKPFLEWAENLNLRSKTVLEPFAGANNIIRSLKEVGYARKFASFDINPQDKSVKRKDTLKNFPTGYSFCVTNPPWLAKNSAHRRGLDFPITKYDDLYKFALSKCLDHCEYVAALIPATYLRSGELREGLNAVIFLHDNEMFSDTDNPVCLALFSPGSSRVKIYDDEKFVGYLDELEKRLPEPATHIRIIFNHPRGDLGLIAIDNTQGPSIRFVLGDELSGYEMKETSRMITRIKIDVAELDKLIKKLNRDLEEFRKSTRDVFLTPFKGLRKDGLYRRRIDYGLAKDFIAKHAALEQNLGI